MDLSQFAGGQYLSQADLSQPAQYATVEGLQEVELEGKARIAVKFKEYDKLLVLGAQCNRQALMSYWGTNGDAYLGRKVHLCRCLTKYMGKPILCVRIAPAEMNFTSVCLDPVMESINRPATALPPLASNEQQGAAPAGNQLPPPQALPQQPQQPQQAAHYAPQPVGAPQGSHQQAAPQGAPQATPDDEIPF